MSLLLDFFLSFDGVASALPVAFPLLQQPAEVVPEVAELLQDFPSADFVAEAEDFEAQQLPPVEALEEEQDAFSVLAFSSFVFELVCALAAIPTNATKANIANNFFILYFSLMVLKLVV